MDARSPARFRSWLLEQLRLRQWTQSDLAAHCNVDRSAITKWLAPVGSPTFRQPTYASCRTLAQVLGVTLLTVLQEAGLEPLPLEVTSLQRRVMGLIPHIPDPMLEVIYHQLVPMANQRVQESVVAALHRGDGAEERPVESVEPPERRPGENQPDHRRRPPTAHPIRPDATRVAK